MEEAEEELGRVRLFALDLAQHLQESFLPQIALTRVRGLPCSGLTIFTHRLLRVSRKVFGIKQLGKCQEFFTHTYIIRRFAVWLQNIGRQ